MLYSPYFYNLEEYNFKIFKNVSSTGQILSSLCGHWKQYNELMESSYFMQIISYQAKGNSIPSELESTCPMSYSQLITIC